MQKLLASRWNHYYKTHSPAQDPWGSKTPDKHVLDFIRFYRLSPRSAILDSGCGRGKNAAWLVKHGYKTYGIDISASAVKHCQITLPAGNFSTQNIISSNFDDAFFDAVIDAGCLHVNHPSVRSKILKEYHRILKPTGKLFLRLFNRTDTSRRDTVIFHVENLPVYGILPSEIPGLLSPFFSVEHTRFKPDYGPLGAFFLYLVKRKS